MQIRWFQTFRAVVDEGSFEMAARAMNCTQSTVSFQIKRLEEMLNVKLFDRVGRRTQLNETGARCLREVDEILNAYDRLRAIDSCEEALCGTLRVLIPESLLTLKMQPVFQKFRKEAPDVRLFAEPKNCYAIGDLLTSGEYDLAVYYDVKEDKEVLDVVPLAQYPMGLFASAELDVKGADFVHEAAKNRIALITNDEKSYFTRMFLRFLRKKKITMNGIMKIDSVEAVKRCVMSNLGVAYMPVHVFAEELAAGKVKTLKTSMKEQTVDCVLAHNRKKSMNAAARLFCCLTLQEFGISRSAVPPDQAAFFSTSCGPL